MIVTPPSIYERRSPGMRSRLLRPLLLAVLSSIAVISSGCASPDSPSRQFGEILQQYPDAQEPLRIRMLSASSANDVAPALQGKAVTIMVHPAYSLFFRDEHRNSYTEAKYDLLKFQLDNEVRFISEIARTENLLILVLPGNFQQDSIAPLSYTYYLNAAAGAGASVYYLTSETWNNGTLSMDSMVTLYGFLKKVGATRMLIGGGYIGRCQREFYNQVSAYVDRVPAYIVPEISSISPDDVSGRESAEILASLRQGDYGPVRKFIEEKNKGATDLFPPPVAKGI
jgi:hypothetical protein